MLSVNSEPLVSIIIPTLNRAHLIGETLDSVLAQTYTNWECIVVDDGSTDNTDAVVGTYVAKDSRFKYYHRPPEHLLGGNGARNFGFKMSQGKYVQFFDSDDIMIKTKLEKQVAVLSSIGSHVANFCSGKKVNFEASLERSLRKDFTKSFFEQIALNSSEILTPSMLIYRDFLIEWNFIFDEYLSKSQETDFYLNLSEKFNGNEISFLEEELFLYRYNPKGIAGGDGLYQHKYQFSKAKVFIKALRLGFKFQNDKVIQKMYPKTVKIFFAALRNDDVINYQYILNEWEKILKPSFSKLYLKLWLIVKFSAYFSLPYYRLEFYFTRKPLHLKKK